MKIIGFLQVRNELKSGHLERFLEINGSLFDALFVYDDCSDDGTFEHIQKYATRVIQGNSRQFGQELTNKGLLLDAVKDFGDPGDAILWLDADEVIYASPSELKQMISESFALGFDGIQIPHINLWRSHDWFRIDNQYDDLKPVRIWKLSNKLKFPSTPGLHQQMHPQGIRAVRIVDSPQVVHFGFASTNLILSKYANYRLHWQSGQALHRLISEDGRQLSPLVSREKFLGSRFRDLHPFDDYSVEPQKLSPTEWYLRAQRELGELTDTPQKPKVTLVSLIFSSTSWLSFQYGEMLRLQRELPIGEVEILFVANDANADVLEFLKGNNIPHIAVNTKMHENEWFINSVYRAYNLAVHAAKGEYVLLANSDMAYAPGALSSLIRHANPKKFLAGRLVELGVLPTGKYGIEKDFGSKAFKFRRTEFYEFAKKIIENKVAPGGLFMPLLVNRAQFIEIGGYPEGNLVEGTLEKYLNEGIAEYAEVGQASIPGDVTLMAKAKRYGIEHETVFSSVSYHFQAGERREKAPSSKQKSGYAVVNDSLVGINGERVLWGQVVARLQARGNLVQTVSHGFPKSHWESFTSPVRLWLKVLFQLEKPRVIFSNATYQIPIFGNHRRVVLRQDMPKGRLYKLLQTFSLGLADQILANDAEFVDKRAGAKTDWVLVPLAEIWWDQPKRSTRNLKSDDIPTIVFVGSFNDTKGWAGIKKMVLHQREKNWLLVSKYAKDEHGIDLTKYPNVDVMRCLSSEELKAVYERADIILVNSPFETQNLVSIEAASQGVVVVTTPTGFLGSFGLGEHEFGIVSHNVEEALATAISHIGQYSPRDYIEKFNLTNEGGWKNWVETLHSQLQISFLTDSEPSGMQLFLNRLRAYLLWLIRKVLRNSVFPTLIRIKRAAKKVLD